MSDSLRVTPAILVPPRAIAEAAELFVSALGTTNAHWLEENLRNVETNSDAMRELKHALFKQRTPLADREKGAAEHECASCGAVGDHLPDCPSLLFAERPR